MSTTIMKTATETPFESFLNQHDEEGWLAAVTILLRSIHDVDKTATQIWISLYPLGLFTALKQAADPDRGPQAGSPLGVAEKLARELLLQGDYYLKNQIDSSHKFIYGHRYWPEVKKAVEQYADEWNRLHSVSNVAAPQAEAHDTSLADHILEVAQSVASELRVGASLLVGITAVAFMTVRQTGLEASKAAPGKVLIDAKHAKKSPDQVLSARAKDDSQGLLGFLKTVDKKWTVNHDENDDAANYKLNNAQDLAWGAEADRSRDWRAIDPRRVEGPIPVECRSASCGTCWVGVIGGAEKLSDVAAREGKQIKKFGYIDTTEPKPLIRLACQAQAHGAV
ncbi:MAG: 2Fe-2S iron-sulfur cluster-binding protein, partial [Terriglobia bacterium]